MTTPNHSAHSNYSALLHYLDSRIATLDGFLSQDDGGGVANEIAMLRQSEQLARAAELETQQAQDTAVPVAWLLIHSTQGFRKIVISENTANSWHGWNKHPLYTIPSAQPTEGSATDGWQPIETAPKDGQVFIYQDGRMLMVEASSLELRIYCGKVDGNKIDYWMPLPSHPIPKGATSRE